MSSSNIVSTSLNLFWIAIIEDAFRLISFNDLFTAGDDENCPSFRHCTSSSTWVSMRSFMVSSDLGCNERDMKLLARIEFFIRNSLLVEFDCPATANDTIDLVMTHIRYNVEFYNKVREYFVVSLDPYCGFNVRCKRFTMKKFTYTPPPSTTLSMDGAILETSKGFVYTQSVIDNQYSAMHPFAVRCWEVNEDDSVDIIIGFPALINELCPGCANINMDREFQGDLIPGTVAFAMKPGTRKGDIIGYSYTTDWRIKSLNRCLKCGDIPSCLTSFQNSPVNVEFNMKKQFESMKHQFSIFIAAGIIRDVQKTLSTPSVSSNSTANPSLVNSSFLLTMIAVILQYCSIDACYDIGCGDLLKITCDLFSHEIRRHNTDIGVFVDQYMELASNASERLWNFLHVDNAVSKTRIQEKIRSSIKNIVLYVSWLRNHSTASSAPPQSMRSSGDASKSFVHGVLSEILWEPSDNNITSVFNDDILTRLQFALCILLAMDENFAPEYHPHLRQQSWNHLKTLIAQNTCTKRPKFGFREMHKSSADFRNLADVGNNTDLISSVLLSREILMSFGGKIRFVLSLMMSSRQSRLCISRISEGIHQRITLDCRLCDWWVFDLNTDTSVSSIDFMLYYLCTNDTTNAKGLLQSRWSGRDGMDLLNPPKLLLFSEFPFYDHDDALTLWRWIVVIVDRNLELNLLDVHHYNSLAGTSTSPSIDDLLLKMLCRILYEPDNTSMRTTLSSSLSRHRRLIDQVRILYFTVIVIRIYCPLEFLSVQDMIVREKVNLVAYFMKFLENDGLVFCWDTLIVICKKTRNFLPQRFAFFNYYSILSTLH